MNILHLQNRFKSGPTWSMHERGAQRCVVRRGDFAEEFEFVLCDGVVSYVDIAAQSWMIRTSLSIPSC